MKAAKDKSDFLSDWFVSRTDHSTQDPNVGFVETLYQTCSAALIYLWKSQFRSSSPTLHKRTLQRDVESFRLWAENFPSAHLDEILGESSDLKINVLENLTGIGKILVPYFVDCKETGKGRQNEKNLKIALTQELETQLEKAKLTLSAEERSDSSSDDETSDDSSSPTERQDNRLGRLHCYISCLVDLAPVIEKNVSCLYRKVEAQPVPTENMFRLSHEAQPYAVLIRDRFLNAPIHLIERLAEANWERSIRIRAQKEEEEESLAVRDAQTLFKPYSIFQDSGIGSSIPAVSQYAATVASHTSFLSIAGEDTHGRPRVPPLLQEYRRPFECDYCGKTVSMRNRIEWKMHVFADLQSYLCTHEDCRDALKTFPTRKLWVDHEFNKHFTRQQWRCFTCRTTTSTQQSFVDHLTNDHNIVLTGHRLTAAIAEAQESDLTPEFMNHKCALCSQSGWQSKKAYATHVGQHLEEISLACLPRDEGDSSDDASDTDTSSATTQIYVARPDRSQNPDVEDSSDIQNIQSLYPLPRTYPARGRHVSPYIDPPPVDLPDNLHRYQSIPLPPIPIEPIPTERNFPSPSKSFPLPWQSRISDSQSALNDQVAESVSAVVHDIQTSTMDNTAILHEPGAKISTSTRLTSYWSVDEQRMLPQMLDQFGLDFERIAKSMKSKTPQMVQNYYQRLVKERKLEDSIADGKMKKALGIPDLTNHIYHRRRREDTDEDSTQYPQEADHRRPFFFDSSFGQNYQQTWIQSREISSQNTPQHTAYGFEHDDPSARYGNLIQYPTHQFEQHISRIDEDFPTRSDRRIVAPALGFPLPLKPQNTQGESGADWIWHDLELNENDASEGSEVSVANYSPILPRHEYDEIENNALPSFASQNYPALYDNALGIEQFLPPEEHHQGFSPAHSLYMSPRVMPKQTDNIVASNQYTPTSNQFPPAPTEMHGMPGDNIIGLNPAGNIEQASQMAPPSINVEFAPPPRNLRLEPVADFDSLSPPKMNYQYHVKGNLAQQEPFRPSSEESGKESIPHNRDQHPAISTTRAQSQRLAQLQPMDYAVRGRLAPIRQVHVNPRKPEEDLPSMHSWNELHPLPGFADVLYSSIPIPFEPRENFDWNSGQQQHQHSGYQRQVPATEARLGDRVLMSFLGPDAPHLNDDTTPQASASGSRLSVSKDDEESWYPYKITPPPKYGL